MILIQIMGPKFQTQLGIMIMILNNLILNKTSLILKVKEKGVIIAKKHLMVTTNMEKKQRNMNLGTVKLI